MKIRYLIPAVVFGGLLLEQPTNKTRRSVDQIGHPNEHLDDEINGDMIFTPCQAAIMRLKNNEIPIINNEILEDDDEYCQILYELDPRRRGAIRSTNYWKSNFNEQTNRFKIPYRFAGSHNDRQMDQIRKKLTEFRKNTCVDLFEISRIDDGPFQGIYNNVLEVRLAILSLEYYRR